MSAEISPEMRAMIDAAIAAGKVKKRKKSIERINDQHDIWALRQLHKGHYSRTVADICGKSSHYLRALKSRVIEADLKHSAGDDLEAAKRFWGKA